MPKTLHQNKVVRSICYFADKFDDSLLKNLESVHEILLSSGFEVQTKRLCLANEPLGSMDSLVNDDSIYLSAGSINRESAGSNLGHFLSSKNTSFNLELTAGVLPEDVELLQEIISENAEKTFGFAFTFSNRKSSPFFPSAEFEKNGFSIGLQPTDLAEGCLDLEEWFSRMGFMWDEIIELFNKYPDFLGIDSSVAPLFSGKSSLINFIKRLHGSFEKAVTTDTFLKITDFIKSENPRPAGLCGVMFPCLEDFELAEEYDKGRFPIERNIFLAMHCGLGIDTYPVGIDESPKRILEVLRLLRALSVRYGKALSARFVSDGKAKIGENTRFQNQYLKDVIIRPL
ncbi:MAG TPA: DUF711 family protein [Desulfobacteraceae bacterium]|nr:DUF711 family protein [Desulfobacteraceae bacterium]HPJ67765.1 DUF711 family protein [Desulfobacteraceae bacterium]HPQ28835.1 DUF711 family protein [Desulfobacteraceae bacterium]